MKESVASATLVVLISGKGTNLQAILDAVADKSLPCVIAGVISNKSDAYGLERARQAGVPAIAFIKKKTQTRQDYDRELAALVASFKPDWVVLAGWMRLLSMAFLGEFPNQVVNIHPALPGAFPGINAVERAYNAYQRGEIMHTGVMIHLVPDEAVDAGPVLNKEIVPIGIHDKLGNLEQRIHQVEHRLYVETLRQLICTETTY